MYKLHVSKEEHLTQLSVSIAFNAIRPSDMADLLVDAAKALEDEERKMRTSQFAPFTVKDVVIDVTNGCVTFYLQLSEE